MLCKGITGDIILSHWRFSEVSGLCKITSGVVFNAHVIGVPSENLTLFSHEAALKALDENLGDICRTLAQAMQWMMVMFQDLS